MATLLDRVGRELEGALRRYVGGAIERWDHIYARGFGDARGGAATRAKHYVIAGVVADACGRAPRVLEVGCGFGTTFRFLRRIAPTYTGIDTSRRAIARCRERWGDEPGCAWEVASFETWEPKGTFDAIVLDDALQTVPAWRAAALVEKAAAHLSGPRAVLVISLSSLVTGPVAWVACRSALPAPHQHIAVQGGPYETAGGRAVVRAFTNLRVDAEDERAAPPVSGIAAPISSEWDKEKVS